MPVRIANIEDVRAAESVIREHVSPAPLIRSYALERELGLPPSRRVWLKDFGWTPSGSFKLLGALNWLANNRATDRRPPRRRALVGELCLGNRVRRDAVRQARDRRHAGVRPA